MKATTSSFLIKKLNKINIFLVFCFFFLFNQSLKSQPSNPFGNALVPDMIADASIQEIDGVFYCYATTDGYDNGLHTSGPPVVWKSKDFVNWSFSGYYFPSAVGQVYWAPSKVVQANGKYYIYPTINKFMYPAVSDSPDGPFKLAKGEDEFIKPYSPSSTLLKANGSNPPWGIDAEIFIDDDNQAYVYWQKRNAARLNSDMISLDSTSIITIDSPRKSYSEGPIFFKRKGIYYYLYSQGGDERYQYAYMMSTSSPLGPFEAPQNDIISTTNYERGVFGPGHGCVFNLSGTDDYYFAYLEFGRRSTNRQTYVNKLEFNEDGTIRPVDLTLDGVGALRKIKQDKKIAIKSCKASSVRDSLKIAPNQDSLLNRTEYFVPEFAFDSANGSRWMPNNKDEDCWLTADLGKTRKLKKSEVFFVRPTAGHAYILEYSTDGKSWKSCGGHDETEIKSPHTDVLNIKARYLRLKITKGIKGVWEWNIF
ncbi:glycosyl hydrolase family 43 [Dysgonomonas sp. 216]|uniref:family 43 glycosylhydrolase n=1 Tax=Dysgonomonas sp. 216 TaxID=2302934 RepID=UPI0013D2B6D6|nr:family 43 glycosylhydrolase [Dysgonomonas sp. 216]NDW17757.1 glycosyl hydrolase family 43 [Dysgonomonas sp. 216]